jgi:hypothetical protein
MATRSHPRVGLAHPTVVPTNFDPDEEDLGDDDPTGPDQ